jgi:hypothetical protein
MEEVTLPASVNQTKKQKNHDRPIKPIHKPAKLIHGPPPQLTST